ncbi:MAG: lipocalin family protein [Pseudomonadota bacterium]
MTCLSGPGPPGVAAASSALCSASRWLLVLGCLAAAVVAVPVHAGEDEAAGGTAAARAAPPVVDHVDLQRYSGKWYELARLPNSFQRNCAGDVTADYELGREGRMTVVNQCTRKDGSVDVSTGEARQPAAIALAGPGAPGQGMLQVRFAPRWLSWVPAVWGDYWILALDEGYETALVGTPDRDYLWLLSRAPQRPVAEVAAWLQKAADLGYPVERVIRTAQDPAPAAGAPAGEGTTADHAAAADGWVP